MKARSWVSVAACTAVLFVVRAAAAQHPMPPGMTHEQHLAQMKKDAELKRRGDLSMGLDQDKTTHHFHLTAQGGTIEISTRDDGDETSRSQIRAHLQELVREFAQGNFQKPFMTHDETAPGVPTMERLKESITYAFEESEHGALLRITTANTEAIDAVHAFLRFQITEHATGDPLTVSSSDR